MEVKAILYCMKYYACHEYHDPPLNMNGFLEVVILLIRGYVKGSPLSSSLVNITSGALTDGPGDVQAPPAPALFSVLLRGPVE